MFSSKPKKVKKSSTLFGFEGFKIEINCLIYISIIMEEIKSILKSNIINIIVFAVILLLIDGHPQSDKINMLATGLKMAKDCFDVFPADITAAETGNEIISFQTEAILCNNRVDIGIDGAFIAKGYVFFQYPNGFG